jgi:hypothetical protein
MSVEYMPDERLAHFYDNIRQQVEADRANKHQFMANPTVLSTPSGCETR